MSSVYHHAVVEGAVVSYGDKACVVSGTINGGLAMVYTIAYDAISSVTFWRMAEHALRIEAGSLTLSMEHPHAGDMAAELSRRMGGPR